MNNTEYSLIALLLNYPEYYQRMHNIDNVFIDQDCFKIYDVIRKQKNFTSDTVYAAINGRVNKYKFEEIYNYDFYEDGFEGYIKYIRTISAKNKIIRYAEKLKSSSYIDIEEIALDIRNLVGGIDSLYDENIQSSREIIKEMQCQDQTICKLVSSCVPYIDKRGGLEDTDYVIIAARPSDGKTTKALNLMGEDVARKLKIGFFTTETRNKKVMSLLACMMAGIHEIKYRTNQLNPLESEKLSKAFEILYNTEMYLDGTPRLYLDSLKRKAREMVRKYGVQKIYVDYLQRIQHYDKRIIGRYELITYISSELKALAVELGVPFVVLAQLNRENVRADREPNISDLKGSGDIEQDADIIILLHHELVLEDGDAAQIKNIVGKYRNGPKGYYKSVFNKPLRRMLLHDE
jgi:replicative DNA helicase